MVMVVLFIVKDIGRAGRGCRESSVHTPGPAFGALPPFMLASAQVPPQAPAQLPLSFLDSLKTQNKTWDKMPHAQPMTYLSLGTTPTMQGNPLLTPGLRFLI